MDKNSKIILQNLKEDLKVYKDFLKETSEEMIEGGYTQFPIFIAHYFEVKMGETIIDRKEIGTHFNIEASTIEEFSKKSIIQKDRVAEFKNTYKNPKNYMCLFLLTEKGGSFLFFPYKADVEKDMKI